MTNPNLAGGGIVEVFNGAFYIPDFENPEYHDGSLVHYSHLVATSEAMGLRSKIGGQAANILIREAVLTADSTRLNSVFKMEPFHVRSLDWRYNFAHPSSPEAIQKRLRLFLTNDLAADTFYDHVIPTASDWPSQYLDVIEAILTSRGHARPSEKRSAQLARRESQA